LRTSLLQRKQAAEWWGAQQPGGNLFKEHPKPIVVEGAGAPGLLAHVHAATQPLADGYAPRLLVLESDVSAWLELLAHEDVSATIRDERVWIGVGPGARAAMVTELRRRLDVSLPGNVITLGASAVCEPELRAVMAEQQALHARLREQAERVYAGRDAAWWRGRFARGGALKVLLPTTRYSTFVRHSAEDLAEALVAQGHEARVLMEPDDHSKLATPAYLRELAEWTPDVVVLINYTRSSMGQAMVANVPCVCWIQDAMPHLFNRQTGAAQGAMDFLAGYLPDELFAQFGHPRERTLNCPVVVSERKFSAAPAAKELLQQHACEVAYVSHQSEAPEVFCQRMLAAAPAGTPARKAVEAAIPLVHSVVADAMGVIVRDAVKDAARTALRSATGNEVAPEVVATFVNQFCAPLAERIFRHEMLEWAAAIAARRGWRMRLYGRGWEKHPRLAALAQPELEHGEALRASYQAARVHLHASTYSIVHQRVMECALAGGLPLCRLQKREVLSVKHRLVLEAALSATERWETEQYIHVKTGDSPMLMRLAELEHDVGWTAIEQYCVKRDVVDAARARGDIGGWAFADWLLGDVAGMTFWNVATLESRLAQAVESEEWRRNASVMVARRVRGRMTTDVLARGIVELVGGGSRAFSGRGV